MALLISKKREARKSLHQPGWITLEGGFAARVASIRYNIRLWRTKQFRGYYKFVIVRHLPKSLMRFYYASIRPKIVRAQTP